MISDAELLSLNRRGFIPGPKESEEDFLKRVSVCEHFFNHTADFFAKEGVEPPFPIDQAVRRHHWDLRRCDLKKLFDIAPDWLSAYFSNRKLAPWHGAMTWILQDKEQRVKLPLLQFRSQLKKDSYLGIYHLDEIMAHECAHAARAAFDEPVYEEVLSYLTSSSLLRRVFGPMIKKPWEILLFFFFLCGILFWQAADLLGDFSFLVRLFYLLSGAFLSLGILRLGRVHRRFKKAYKKLRILVNDNAFPVLFRLTDKEINVFAKISLDEIENYAEKEPSLRWRLLRLAYFLGEK